jgi:predicted transcriptional regulator
MKREKTVLVRMEPELHKKLEDQCVRLQMDRSAIIRMAIVRFLEGEQKWLDNAVIR